MISRDLGMEKIRLVKTVQIRSFFWSVFSCILTEYQDLLRKSPYSVRIQENTDQKKRRSWSLFTQWLERAFPLLPFNYFLENYTLEIQRRKKKT